MKNQSLLRDVVLLVIAGIIGWWAHGTNSVVRAAGASESSRDGSGLGFQFGGGPGLEGSLTLYNPENKTLYVYPAAAGNAHINCAYSIRVEKPGGPLERQNCGIGSLVH